MNQTIKFFEDIMKAQNDYIAMQSSGFYQHKRVVLILDNIMHKYGMTFEEAEQCARGRMTIKGYYDILRRKEEKDDRSQ